MAKKPLSAKQDYIFKLIFGNQRNSDLLTDFLSSALKIPVEDFNRIIIRDPNLQVAFPEGKLSILDLCIETDERIIDVEIQVANTYEIRERITYYASRLLSEQLGKGDSYKFKQVISIVITDFVLIQDSETYHNCYHLYDSETGSKFSDILEINTLELPKTPKEDKENERLVDWLQFFQADREEELTMLAKKSETMNKAVAIIKELSADEKVRYEADMRERAIRDYNSAMYGAHKQGLEEGIEQGREQGIEQGEKQAKIEMAKAMLKQGMDFKTVASISGLSQEEVDSL